MDELITQLFPPGQPLPAGAIDLGFGHILWALIWSGLLCYVLTLVYRWTYTGSSYTQSFLVAIFYLGVITSVVMIIIGNSVAGAFALAGALSVIRFRTAIKDPRDVAYLFASMVVGMGCGRQQYLASVMLTAFIAVVMLVMHWGKFGMNTRLESIVRVTFGGGDDVQQQIEQNLGQAFAQFNLINRILDFGNDQSTMVYVVLPRRNTNVAEFETNVRRIEGVVGLAVYQSEQHAPI